MDLIEQFHEKFGENLGRRVKGFECALKHLDLNVDPDDKNLIIETGTARTEGNWQGDGQSTLIWDWFAEQKYTFGEQEPRVGIISIDNNKEAIETAQKQTKHVTYSCCDSLQQLAILNSRLTKCRLLYLDSFDWSQERNLESALHHMYELALCYKALPRNCMIMIDDCHTQHHGKHFIVRDFFEKIGVKPVFEAYQTAWIKGRQ